MKISIRITIFAAVAGTQLFAAPQASAPGKVVLRTAPTPTPTPTPQPTSPVTISPAGNQPKAGPGSPNPNTPPRMPTPFSPAMTQLPLASATALAGPKYSPAQLDFGTVDYKASAQRTFSLTAPSAGLITLQLSRGGFVALEVRRVPPAQGTIQTQRPAPSKPTPFQVTDFYRVYEWNLAAGEEIQFDIAFTPSDQNDASPGPRSGILTLSGSGNHPWHVNIPLRGAVAGALTQTNPTAAPSAQSKKPGPGSPSNTAPATVAAMPTPISPAQAPPPLGSAPISNAPIHAPGQFDFGEVWDGDLVKKTFSLTANGSGTVRMELPAGPFRVAEIREMGPMGGSKNPGGQSPMLGPSTKNRIKFTENQPGPYTYHLEPGGEIQVDVYFQPHFKFGSEMAGQKNATLKVSGPGPKFNWTLSIPLRGMFDGLKLSATIVPQVKELFALAGDKVLPVNVTLFGLETPVSGTIKLGANPPAGVSIIRKNVQVAAKQKTGTTVWLSLAKFAADGVSRPLELVFDDGTKTSKTLLQFTGVANSRSFSSGERGDCGISGVRLKVTLQGTPHIAVDNKYLPGDGSIEGSIAYTYSGSATDNPWVDKWPAESIWLAVEMSGKKIFKQGFDIHGWEQNKKDASTITDSSSTAFHFTGDQWQDILSSSARIGCQLSAYYKEQEPNELCAPNYHQCTEWKWASAQ